MNKIELTEEQILKKKELIQNIKIDIENLKKEIALDKKKNIKNHGIRNLKISLRMIEFIGPYVLSTGLLFLTFKNNLSTPFILDNIKKESNIEKQIDSLNNIVVLKQYEEFENSKNTISNYSSWKLTDDDSYLRTIKVYELKEIDEQELQTLINNITPEILDTITKENPSTQTEIKYNLINEELNTNSFYKAVIHSKDMNDFIMVKESVADNNEINFLYCIMNSLVIWAIFIIRRQIFEYKFFDKINKIDEQTMSIDYNEKKKILSIKKDNYERLTDNHGKK